MERYKAGQGQQVSYPEMVQAFERMTGAKAPTHKRDVLRKNCQLLMGRSPLRWEFEINRCRGYAFDNGEGCRG